MFLQLLYCVQLTIAAIVNCSISNLLYDMEKNKYFHFFLFIIPDQLRIFWVPDPDPTHTGIIIIILLTIVIKKLK